MIEKLYYAFVSQALKNLKDLFTHHCFLVVSRVEVFLVCPCDCNVLAHSRVYTDRDGEIKENPRMQFENGFKALDIFITCFRREKSHDVAVHCKFTHNITPN